MIVITAGDARGIGPEIIRKALRDIRTDHPLLVLGDPETVEGLGLPRSHSPEEAAVVPRSFHIPPGLGHPACYHLVRAGVDLVLGGKGGALVTGPISKERWSRFGIAYRGHTGLLAELAGVSEYAMGFWADNLKTVLLTTHIPLRQVFTDLTPRRLSAFIRLVNRELKRWFKRDFHYLVPGINPHGGEGGLMGGEEQKVIGPVVEALQQEMNIEGPFPPDTVFLKALNDPDAVVIALYHDQGLIPFKLLNFYRGVNITLGLPFVRTSPDHGPAFDIAGKEIANPESMKAAILLADRLLTLSR